MKKLRSILALLSIILLSATLSQAMEQEEKSDFPVAALDNNNYSEESSSSDSDGYYPPIKKNTPDWYTESSGDDSDDCSPLPEKEKTTEDKYEEQLQACRAFCATNADNVDDAILTPFEQLVMFPMPAELSNAHNVHEHLAQCVAVSLGHGANPNRVNPQTGNTALADFFINHYSNLYLRFVIKEMLACDARLFDITHNHRSLYYLMQKAISDNKITKEKLRPVFSLFDAKHLAIKQVIEEKSADLGEYNRVVSAQSV